MFVEVPILCNTTDGATLRELGVDADGGYQIRTGSINMALIVGYYPTEDDKSTIISYEGTEFQIELPYKDFQLLLKKSLIS